jgi:hypothetical protein
MDVEKYVRDKIEASKPKLHLISHAQSANGYVFIISKDADRVDSAVLPLYNVEKDQDNETVIQQVIDARFKKLSDHFYPDEKVKGA